jgi:hypothetical protein
MYFTVIAILWFARQNRLPGTFYLRSFRRRRRDVPKNLWFKKGPQNGISIVRQIQKPAGPQAFSGFSPVATPSITCYTMCYTWSSIYVLVDISSGLESGAREWCKRDGYDSTKDGK